MGSNSAGDYGAPIWGSICTPGRPEVKPTPSRSQRRSRGRRSNNSCVQMLECPHTVHTRASSHAREGKLRIAPEPFLCFSLISGAYPALHHRRTPVKWFPPVLDQHASEADKQRCAVRRRRRRRLVLLTDTPKLRGHARLLGSDPSPPSKPQRSGCHLITHEPWRLEEDV